MMYLRFVSSLITNAAQPVTIFVIHCVKQSLLQMAGAKKRSR